MRGLVLPEIFGRLGLKAFQGAFVSLDCSETAYFETIRAKKAKGFLDVKRWTITADPPWARPLEGQL